MMMNDVKPAFNALLAYDVQRSYAPLSKHSTDTLPSTDTFVPRFSGRSSRPHSDSGRTLDAYFRSLSQRELLTHEEVCGLATTIQRAITDAEREGISVGEKSRPSLEDWLNHLAEKQTDVDSALWLDTSNSSKRKKLESQQKKLESFLKTANEALAAQQKMVEGNQRLVISVVKKYVDAATSLGELVSAGNDGLIRATELFDPTRGTQFSTYAVTQIRRAAFHYKKNKTCTIPLPAYVFDEINAVAKATKNLRQTLDRQPADAEVADYLGISLEKLQERRDDERTSQPFSLDQLSPWSESDGQTLMERTADEKSEQPDDALVKAELSQTVKTLLAKLTPDDQALVKRYFNLDHDVTDDKADPVSESRLTIKQRSRVKEILAKLAKELRL